MTDKLPVYFENPDGSRTYTKSGRTYMPVKKSDRKIGVNKPDDPRAVRFHGRWFLPLPLLELAQRVMPETRPDSESKGHARKCRCHPCRRPGGPVWQRQQRLEERRQARATSASAGAPAQPRP